MCANETWNSATKSLELMSLWRGADVHLNPIQVRRSVGERVTVGLLAHIWLYVVLGQSEGLIGG